MIQTALHITAAALLALLLGETTPLVLVMALLLSLAPDLDTPKSLIGSLCPSLSRRIERTIGHRTITHSLAALAFVAGIAYVLARPYWLVLAGAYGSHLALDLLLGVQGITLFWPSGAFLTLAGWRNDGPAPRRLLLILLPITLLATAWPQLAPLLAPTLDAAASVANPLATPKPTPATPTPVPAITLHIALPAGVGLSALRVQVGDTLREGQLLARWEAATPNPWLSPTAPAPPPTPAVIPVGVTDSSAARGVAEADAALQALTTSYAAERTALLAAQQRDRSDLQRILADAQRTLDQLQPQHERSQAEHQHAIEAAAIDLADARAAQQRVGAPLVGAPLVGAPLVGAPLVGAPERVHSADAALQAALDAQDRMRAEQGIERAAAEAAVAQAQADLDALPAQQRQALAKLDADQHAARILAAARIDSARSQADDARRDAAARRLLADASATAAAHAWQADVTTTAQAHAEAATATAAAIPTPAPNQILSRAAGRIVAISAEEQSGQLVVTLEIAP